MSRATALTLLYNMVDDMTIANGFNYDWNVHKGGDKFRGVRGQTPAITISFGAETNVDDRGGVGSWEYIDDANFTVTGKVCLSGANVPASEVAYEEQLAISRALDDIKTRYDSEGYLCANGLSARQLKYLGSDVLDKIDEQKYTTMRIECNFNLKYVTQRKLLDK